MVPNSAWHDLGLSVQVADWETAKEQAQDFLDWLDRGGFLQRSPMGTLSVRRGSRVVVRTLLANAAQVHSDLG